MKSRQYRDSNAPISCSRLCGSYTTQLFNSPEFFFASLLRSVIEYEKVLIVRRVTWRGVSVCRSMNLNLQLSSHVHLILPLFYLARILAVRKKFVEKFENFPLCEHISISQWYNISERIWNSLTCLMKISSSHCREQTKCWNLNEIYRIVISQRIRIIGCNTCSMLHSRLKSLQLSCNKQFSDIFRSKGSTESLLGKEFLRT